MLRIWFRLLCVAIWSFSATLLGQGPDPESELHRLKKENIDARTALQSGQFACLAVVKAGESESEHQYRIWFQDNAMRIDTLIDPKTKAWEKFSVVGDSFKMHDESVTADGKRQAAAMGKLTGSYAAKNRRFDPRAIGLFASSFGHLHAIDWKKEFPTVRPHDLALKTLTDNGLDVTQVSYTSVSKAKVTLHFLPGRQNVLRMVRLEVPDADEPLVDTAVSEYEGDVHKKARFPSKVVFTRHRGKKLLLTETVTISNARFNHKIDSAVFSFEGMNVPENTTVLSYPPEKDKRYTPVWDGKKLDYSGRSHAPQRTMSSRTSQYWVVAAIAFGGAAAGCILLIRRKPAP